MPRSLRPELQARGWARCVNTVDLFTEKGELINRGLSVPIYAALFEDVSTVTITETLDVGDPLEDTRCRGA